MSEPDWLVWAKRLQAISQSGLYFCKDPFDLERYQQAHDLAMEMMANGSDLELLHLKEQFSQEAGYATPKMVVRGAVFKDDKILMVQEHLDKLWTLPGGFADVNISPQENIVKEIQEESGYLTQVNKLAALYDRQKHSHPAASFHYYVVFFICDLIGGEAQTSIETDAVEFFGEDELPELSPGRINEHQIRRMFVHHRQPGLPADYD
ncbi:MAG: NUDIX hydrolase [Pseudomonadota bacterium]